MNRRKKNNILIGVLCCALVFMGIGYAVLNATLSIGATANITGDFDIHFYSIERSATSISDSTILSTIDNGTGITNSPTNTEGQFTAVLQKPGDYVTYDVVVKNTGSIDGYLTFTFGDTNNNFDYYDDFFSVEFIRDDTEPDIIADILQNQTFTDNEVLVKTSGTRTYKIKVTYKDGATSFPDPTHEINNQAVGNFECTFNLTYSQNPPEVILPSQESLITVVQSYDFNNREYTNVDESLSEYGASNLSRGDLIQFDTEQFYVLEATENTIRALTRYNLNVGPNAISGETAGMQDSSSNFNLIFSSDAYWAVSGAIDITTYNTVGTDGYPFVYDSNSNLYQYISGENGYVNKLIALGLNVTNGSLMSSGELRDTCVYTSGNKCPTYIRQTDFWSGSAYNATMVYGHVSWSGPGLTYGAPTTANALGLRPVITISLA